MKLNRIFIALLSAFLCATPQIVMTAADLAGDVERDLTEEAESALKDVGEDGEMTPEQSKKLEDALGKLQAQDKKAFEDFVTKNESKLNKITEKNEKFIDNISKKTEELEQGTDELSNEISKEAAAGGSEQDATGEPGEGATDGSDQAAAGEPDKGATDAQQELNVDNAVDGFKQLRENVNSSAEDLLKAQEKTMSGIQDQMKDELDVLDGSTKMGKLKGIGKDSAKDLGYSDQDIKDFRDKIKGAKTKEQAMNAYRDFKEDMSARKFLKESGVNNPEEISGKMDKFKELKEKSPEEFEEAIKNLSPDDQTLFDGLKANKNTFEKFGSEEFARLTPEDIEQFNKYVDSSFEESAVEYRNKLRDKIDAKFKKEGEPFFDPRKNLEFSEGKLDTKLNAIGRGAKDMLKQFGHALKDLPLSLFNAVVFMVPNLIQAAIVGGQQKKSEVLQWAKPVEFGGKVYQIPNKCLQLGSVDVLSQGAASYVSGSIPVYVQIPVKSVGDTVSTDVSKLFDSNDTIISGPSGDDASAYYNANRYTIKPAFYDLTDIVVSYGSAYSSPTGSSRIFGSEFTGQVISLKTGMVTDASGEIYNATELPLVDGVSQYPAVPLLDVVAWGNLAIPQTSPINSGLQSAHAMLPTILEKFEAASITSGNLYSQFDTSCLKPNGGLDAATCSCMLVSGLEELQAGLDLDKNGKTIFTEEALPSGGLNIIGAKSGKTLSGLQQGTASSSSLGSSSDPATISVPTTSQKGLKLGRLSDAGQTSSTSGQTGVSASSSSSKAAAASSFNGLGSVIPVFGWGSDPKNNQVDTIIGKLDSTTKTVADGQPFTGFKYQKSGPGYADDDTIWSVQGCWVYLCATTPFINILKQKLPGLIPPAVAGSITDYIVFMDGDGNIIPLMAPENIAEQTSAKETIWSKSTFTVNPAIKYWTSLVFYNDDYMIEELTGQAATAPIMFELSDPKATPIPYAELGALQSAGPSSGKVQIFLNNAGQTANYAPFPISQTFPDIYNQIEIHRQALQFKSQQIQMQFDISGTSVNLLSKYSLSVTGSDGSKIKLPVYSGAKCLGVSNVDDLLIAFDDQMSSVVLPDSKVKFLMSLVTDIIYEKVGDEFKVALANSLPGAPKGFTGYSSSPLKLDPTTQLPVKNESGGYDIDIENSDNLNNLSQYAGSTITIKTKAKGANKDIIALAQKNRIAWLKAIDNVIELSYTDQDGKESSMLCNLVSEISDSYVQSKKCYVYEIDPLPSIVYTTSDIFVFVDSSAPTLESLSSLQKLSADSNSGYFLSLVTGTLYDVTDGSAVQDSDGNPVRIKIPNSKYFSSTDSKTTADVIYETFIAAYPGLSKEFKTKYSKMVSNYNKTQAIPQGPYSFGKYKVAIRSIDDALSNYVYFNASEMTKYNIKPKDMYLVLTKTDTGYQPGSYDKSKSQILMSLITGIAVDQNGNIVGRQPQSKLEQFITLYSSSPFIAQNIKRLQAEYNEKQEALRKEAEEDEEAMKKAAAESENATYENGKVVLKIDQAAATIIRRLTPAGKGLPAPFAGLQQDPTTGNYVHISPTQTKGELIYTFMDSGKIYNYAGGFVMQLSNGHLQAIRDQLGVVVDSKTGKQKLGIPQFQPSLRLSAKDKALQVGQTGEDMIAVGSADYPDATLSMLPGYGLYYSRSMETYYVLDSKNNIWMSVDAGHVYNKDGSTIPDSKSVAIYKGKTKDYPLLIEMNESGYLQGFLPDGSEYVNLSSSNKSMQWLGMSGDFNQYSVVTNAASSKSTPTMFKVAYSKGKTRTFKVDSSYSWQQLAFIPIDNSGKLLEDSSDDMSKFMELVYNGSNLEFVIYNDSIYTAKSLSKFMYSLKPFNVNDSNAKTGLKVTVNALDKDTGNTYAQVTDGKNVYKFGYMPKIFDTQEQAANRTEIIKGIVVPAPVAVNVGPYQEVTVKVGNTSVKKQMPSASTHVLFGADLPIKSKEIDTSPALLTDIINPVEISQGVAYETFVYDLKLSGSSLGNGILKTADGRFIYKIAAQKFSYVLEDAYVDLKNGILFDASTGLALGMGLMIQDFESILNDCGCTVTSRTTTTKDKDGKDVTVNPKGINMLQYRGVLKKTDTTTQVAAN